MPIDQDVQRQVEKPPEEVAEERGSRPRDRERRQRAHQLHRVEGKDEAPVAMAEVVAQELGRARPAPLPLDRQVVEVVIEVNEEPAGETPGRQLGRTGDGIARRAERDRRREVASWSHA